MSTIRKQFVNRFEKIPVIGEAIDRAMIERGMRMGISALALVVVWQIVASLFFEPQVLPTPVEVGQTLLDIFDVGGPRGNSAWYHLWQSLVRVVIAAAVGMSIAVVLGVLMGINDGFEAALSTWLPFWMTVPTVVVVLVTMVIFQFSETAVVVAVVFAATPYATVNTWKGVENVDPALVEMSNAFSVSQASILRHIYLPSMLPSIFGSLRYLFSIVWKIVVLAEVFGMDNGLGAMFRFWYNQADIVSVLAYLVLFVGVMFIIEYGVLYPLEKHLFRWRDS